MGVSPVTSEEVAEGGWVAGRVVVPSERHQAKGAQEENEEESFSFSFFFFFSFSLFLYRVPFEFTTNKSMFF